MEQEVRYLTAKEATSLLNKKGAIHTFVNPGNNVLIGADWSRREVLKLLKSNSGKIELGGEACRKMNHAIVVFRGSSPLFIENNKEALELFDPIAID